MLQRYNQVFGKFISMRKAEEGSWVKWQDYEADVEEYDAYWEDIAGSWRQSSDEWRRIAEDSGALVDKALKQNKLCLTALSASVILNAAFLYHILLATA